MQALRSARSQRNRTINRHIRSVFDEETLQSQLSMASALDPSTKKLQEQYFESSQTNLKAKIIANQREDLEYSSNCTEDTGSSLEKVQDEVPDYLPSYLNRNEDGVERELSNSKLTKKLVDQAVLDSQTFLILTPQDLYNTKKELLELQELSESLNQKLTIETKVRDAAIALRKLHKNNPDMLEQTERQLENSNLSLDKCMKQMWKTAHKSWYHHRNLLQHNAAILATVAQLNKGEVMALVSDSYFDNNSTHTKENTNHRCLELEREVDQLHQLLEAKENQILNVQKNSNKACSCDRLQAELDQCQLKLKGMENELEDRHQLAKLLAKERVDNQDLKRKLKDTTQGDSQYVIDKLREELKFTRKETNRLGLELNQTQEFLESIYHQLPDLANTEPEEEKNLSVMDKLVYKLDGLIQENEMLMDQIIQFQERNEQSQGSINENHLLRDIEKLREENLKYRLEKERLEKEFQSRIHQLQEEVESKDILCTKLQNLIEEIN